MPGYCSPISFVFLPPVLPRPQTDFNSSAILAQFVDKRADVPSLVLYSPARSLSNCDGIVWGFGIAQGLVGLCEDFVVVGPVGWR